MATSQNETNASRTWWREAVVYQIYVQSFRDTTGNGIGDLNGIRSKLDYLQSLGVDVLWLTPIFDSPMKDMGYDIRDYQKILPLFGTMEDWENLLEEVHEFGMKLLMDTVMNHTSDQHDWFKESASSRNNPKADWYIWKDPKLDENGIRQRPNNWASSFGDLHIFDPEQPDLNWDCLGVREELCKMQKWWLDKGVDGFRLDVMNMVSKVHGLPDAPNLDKDSKFQPGGVMYLNGYIVYEYMNEKLWSDHDIMTVGEMIGELDLYEASKYVAASRKELSTAFQFAHMNIDELNGNKWVYREWRLTELKRELRQWQQHMTGLHGWNSIVFENHDHPRSLTRYFDSAKPRLRDKACQLLATLQLSLGGTIFIYQGQEIGMTHPAGWTIKDYKDIETHNFYKSQTEIGRPEHEIMSLIHRKSRDNARTPMQWNSTPNAGFTTASKPWLKVNKDYKKGWNVDDQRLDEDSVVVYYARMARLRKANPGLVYGSFEPIDEDNERVFAYVRRWKEQRYFVVLNWCTEQTAWTIPEGVDIGSAELLMENYWKMDRGLDSRELSLQPYEARLYSL
ncbi:MAG: hypothetical protein M1820_005042 [Bogoriella megaspora]|nr:MAG: hypothetical protein M1820_005042 [Bogoriella megaspora]